LGGGSGDLKGPVLDYLRLLKKINHRPMAHPVILVMDNDDGLATVAGTIRKTFKLEINLTTTNPFYRITHNLYLVKTPETLGAHTCIEDLFPQALLLTELEGKKFNMKKAHDAEGEYGKAAFADRVVRASAHTIDFIGFVPLLSRIEAAIAHHQAA
jgi:RNA-directed DNA polymerase